MQVRSLGRTLWRSHPYSSHGRDRPEVGPKARSLDDGLVRSLDNLPTGYPATEADQSTRQMQKSFVQIRPAFVADRETTIRRKPDKRPLDGLLANDKFCMIRHARLLLSHSRRPNLTHRQTDVATAGSAYPPAGITRHGGDDETSVAPTSGSDGTPGCEAALGSGVPGHPAVEPRKRASSCSEGKWRGGVL
jgi:hypothetical protein